MAARRSASSGAKRRLSRPQQQQQPRDSSTPQQEHPPPLRRSRRLNDKVLSCAQRPSPSSPVLSECITAEVTLDSSPQTGSESYNRSRTSAKLNLDSCQSTASGPSRGRGRGRGSGRARILKAMSSGETHVVPPGGSEDIGRDLVLEPEPLLDQPAAKRQRSSSSDSRTPETSAGRDTLTCSTCLEQETPRETELEAQIGASTVYTEENENLEVSLPHAVATGPSTSNFKEENNAELSSGENQAQANKDSRLEASVQEQSTTGPAAEAEAPDGNARLQRRRNRGESSRSRFLQIARERAFHFAHFDANEDEAPAGALPANNRRRGIHRMPRQDPEHQQQQVDWPGPFSTARQLVQNRALAAAARKNMNKPETKASLVDWHPRESSDIPMLSMRSRPSLLDLCLGLVADNAEDVASLEGVPESIRARISIAFCERRKMNAKALSLFFQGTPSEIRVPDCSQVKETELIEMMGQLSTEKLELLYLGFCGRAFSENCLSTICKYPGAYRLRSISLPGAYRLADRGLELLLQYSPLLVHLNLTACSFLTDAAMKSVVKHTSNTLESLVLDSCSNLNAKTIIHDLVKLQKLQKLSLSAVIGVTDEIVSELSVRLGGQLRELSLAHCSALTDAAVAGIGACCSSLQVLNLAHLTQLSDIAIAHITDGLRVLQELDLRRCKFSDEGIAAYVTASGGSLVNLSVNSVHQVGEQTVLALAKHTNTHLKQLDMSFCRLISDESLGFLADSCPHLSVLKLYGCTQVTEKFLKGHRNSNLLVVGL